MKEIELPRARGQTVRRLSAVAVALAIYALLTAALYRQMSRPEGRGEAALTVVRGAAPPTRNVTIRDGWFWADGQRFFVRAVGWDPVRPGEVPWERVFQREEIAADLQRIRAAGFNTVRTWAALTPEELELVQVHGLRVLQGVWVDPDGDFADPEFRRRALADVVRSVEQSRWSPAVLGYLVLNEPRAASVAGAGLDQTRAFLREVVATVRALDPSAPIGYASWPGMEALDDELLDFVAFNLYPHRPRVVMDEFGLRGYVSLLRRTVAAGRPLLISEFGISVSPHSPVPGRGGASDAEQAEQLVELASTYVASGAVGLTVFQWSDGWWKNNEYVGDEKTHDPDDPEEWFGLVKFEDVDDRLGSPRPALEALSSYLDAFLIEPRDGQVDGDAAPILIHSDRPVSLEVSVNQGPRYPVELWPAGPGLWAGKLLISGGGREDVTFHLRDADGAELRTDRRLLRTGPPRQLELAIAPRRLVVAPGARFEVEARLSGTGAPGASVSIAAFTEDRYNEERFSLHADEHGVARVELTAPDQETLLTLIAFEDDPSVPPAERRAAWAVAEVRAR